MVEPTQIWRRGRNLLRYAQKIGTRAMFSWLLLRVSKRARNHGSATWQVRPRIVPHEIEVRLRGTSDFDVFFQIFLQEEYAPLQQLENISFILDLGANVGYSSAYFLSCFPSSTVLAVEPDERNVAYCREMLKPYGDRAKVLHGAAWSEPTTLLLSRGSFGDGREWATQVIAPPSGMAGGVQAWDITSLLHLANRDQIDLLKIDVERAELEIFGKTAAAWLPKVRNLCIELHGPDCEEIFFNALSSFQYDLGHSGELTICTNLQPKADAAFSVV